MSFEKAIAVLLPHEGGFTDNPHDHGGRTNFGITQRTYDQWMGKHGKPCADVRLMSEDTARAIYFEEYWPPFDGIDDPDLATVLFDQGVLRGPLKAISVLQGVLGTKVDGQMTPVLLASVNREIGRELAFRFVRASHHDFIKICVHDPSQMVFLDGWTERLFSLLDVVFFEGDQ